jgi:hypothetical protein
MGCSHSFKNQKFIHLVLPQSYPIKPQLPEIQQVIPAVKAFKAISFASPNLSPLSLG